MRDAEACSAVQFTRESMTQVDGNPLPATGQVAAQEGAYVARLLNRGFDLSAPVPTFPIDEGEGGKLRQC